MSNIIDIPFSGGYVSTGDEAKSADDLAPGELVSMTGAFYRKNDASQPFKMPGRALFGSAGATAIKGMAICQFDEGGNDKLVVSIGTTLVAATPGATGTFSSLLTGLNASATRLTACHQEDRWYLGNGYDKNKVLRPDGTVRDAGMPTPQVKLTATASATSGGRAFPTASTGSFTNPLNAYDASGDATYASGTLSGAGSVTHTWTTWASNTNANRELFIRWRLAGLPLSNDTTDGLDRIGTGGTTDAGYEVSILLEKSDDLGVTWQTAYTGKATKSTSGITLSNIAIAANSNLVHFRATMTYISGTNAATLRIHDVAIQFGSTVANFSTEGTMFYAYLYVNANGPGEIRGAQSETTPVDAFVNMNLVTINRSETPPADATHWLIYRTVPGATDSIDNLGKLALVDIGKSVYYDSFTDDKGGFLDPTVQLLPTVPAMTVGDLSIPRDTQGPAFISMISWSGSVIGIQRTQRRSLRYSEAGRPESFPEFYVVSSFPIDEHDGLVGQMAVGETLVLLMEGAILALDELPRVVDGQFNGADARPLKGHPGCVGEYAYTTFSVAGEPRGAWVSPFGVFITNGTVCACISTDLAWESEVNASHLSSAVLRWDAKNLILWFEFDLDGDGLNDREMPFHMAELHSKSETRPKLGQPTAKATSIMASALIDATHYRYSGHPSDGAVYVEESGYQDAATAANVSMVVRTGKISKQKIDFGIVKATLIHSDFGTGETGTLTTTVYRDSANSSNSRTSTVALAGHRGTTVGVGRAGEKFDFEFSYSGAGTGSLLGVQAEVDGQGRSGSAPRWVSVSATQ